VCVGGRAGKAAADRAAQIMFSCADAKRELLLLATGCCRRGTSLETQCLALVEALAPSTTKVEVVDKREGVWVASLGGR
jgi:hypothetical protein